MNMTPEKLGTLILLPTAEIFQRGIRIKCEICGEELLPGTPVEQWVSGDLWYWVRAECFNDDTPKEAI